MSVTWIATKVGSFPPLLSYQFEAPIKLSGELITEPWSGKKSSPPCFSTFGEILIC